MADNDTMERDSPHPDRWQLAEQSAAFGVWELDPVRQLVHYSPQWKALLGYAATDAPDTTLVWRERVHPDDLAGMVEALGAYLRGAAAAYEHEFRLRAADGSWRWVLSRSRVVERDAAGAPLRAVGTLVDITDRREAEALRAERDRAEAATRAKSAFLARVSHELRTPLNAILGFAQLLGQQIGEPGADTQRQRHQVKQIESAGWHLLRLVEDVLDLSRADTGQLAVARTEVALMPALRAVIAGLAGSAAARGVTLRLVDTPEDARIRADASRLAQVLTQAVGHMLRRQGAGGRVELSLVPAPDAWRVLVTGDGPAIPEAELPHIFEAFGPASAGQPAQDPGLGLALARSLAIRMGGRLAVANVEGGGPRFELELPRVA